MEVLELTKEAVTNTRVFKKNALRIDGLPSDRKAAQFLIQQYDTGSVEGWMAACILGCNGDLVGYETVKHILLHHEGRGYAGTALAKIGGREKYDDLLDIMLQNEHGPVRKEVAYGVTHLASDRTPQDFVDAYQHRKLSRLTVAFSIARCKPSDDFILDLLNSRDEDVKLAYAVVELLLGNKKDRLEPGEQLARAILYAIEQRSISTVPSRKEKLLLWAQSF